MGIREEYREKYKIDTKEARTLGRKYVDKFLPEEAIDMIDKATITEEQEKLSKEREKIIKNIWDKEGIRELGRKKEESWVKGGDFENKGHMESLSLGMGRSIEEFGCFMPSEKIYGYIESKESPYPHDFKIIRKPIMTEDKQLSYSYRLWVDPKGYAPLPIASKDDFNKMLFEKFEYLLDNPEQYDSARESEKKELDDLQNKAKEGYELTEEEKSKIEKKRIFNEQFDKLFA